MSLLVISSLLILEALFGIEAHFGHSLPAEALVLVAFIKSISLFFDGGASTEGKELI